MTQKEFADFLCTFRPGSEHTAEAWYDWAKDLERMDSSDGEIPEGSYKKAEAFLDDIAKELRYIREKYGDEIAGQIVSLADMPACPFPWEMKLAAKHLADGGSIEDIPAMEADGTLEEYDGMDAEKQNGVQISPL